MHHASTTLRAFAARAALVLGAGIGLAAVAGPASPAAAGGVDFVYPVADTYEPGQTATVVGYTSALASPGMPSGGVDDGPWGGRLITDGESGRGVDLGPATVTETGRRDRYAVRLSVTFTVPGGLAPAPYEVRICDRATCTRSLAELYGGTIYVGVDPPVAIDRGWLVDDPAVAELPGDATVSGIAAARIQAGEPVVPWYDAPPEPLPATTQEPPDVVAADPASGGSASGGSAAAGAEGGDTAGELGLADVAPWLVPLALVAAVWRLRRGRPATVVGPATAGASAPAEPEPVLRR